MIEALKERLQAEVERLNYEINFILPKEIEKARAHADVREADIPKDSVGFGSRVTIQDLDTKQKEVYALTLGEFIDGEDAGDEMSISMASPLGKSLMGHKVGEAVTIALPVGKRRLKILDLLTVHEIAGGKQS